MKYYTKKYLSILLCVSCFAAMPLFAEKAEHASLSWLIERVQSIADCGDCVRHLTAAQKSLAKNNAIAPELMGKAIEEAMQILEKNHSKIACDSDLKAIMQSLEKCYTWCLEKNMSVDDDATIDGNLRVHGTSQFDGQVGIGKAPSAYALDIANNNGSRFVGPYNHTQLTQHVVFEKPFEAGVSNAVYGSINFGNVDPVLGGERGTMTFNVSPSWDAAPVEVLRIHGGDAHEVIVSGNEEIMGNEIVHGSSQFNGNVGIGQPAGAQALEVFGNIYAHGVIKGIGAAASLVAQNAADANQQCLIGWDTVTNRAYIGSVEQNVAFRDLQLFIPGSSPAHVYTNANMNIAGDAYIAGSAHVTNTIYTNQPVRMGANVAAASYDTATRMEWARVDAAGNLLDHSAGVVSVSQTGAGLYEITVVPGMIVNPAILVSTESPAIFANYSIVSSDALQTVFVINSNGVDAPFSVMACGLQ